MKETAVVDRAGTRYTVAVRTLCEFTARRGDLNLRFTPAPSAQQGIAGHATVAARRGAGYVRELALEASHESLTVRGRADGFDAGRNRLEEIKTHRGDLDRMPGNQRALHWAQLKTYGALLCMERGIARIEVALVYFDIKTELETVLLEAVEATALCAHFRAQCEAFLAWATAELAHRARRDRHLSALRFPLGELRAGQRQMAEAVYRTVGGGGRLLVQAPTGIGKTLGSLFPALKAAAAHSVDKLFFLVAKTSGRRLALEALALLGANAGTAALRVLELVSKESACLHPGRACDAASCPLAAGFYDRLPAARQAALDRRMLTQAAVRELAGDAAVCPYHLTQELARWCDVIVGDYNYFFDTSAILHGLTAQNQWRIGVLVDEAHNLVGRAREMYSATLDPAALNAAWGGASGLVKARFAQLRHAWRTIVQGRSEDYFAGDEVPPVLVGHLQRLTAAIGDEIAEVGEVDERVLRFHFDALHFCRMADGFGAHALFDVTRAGDDATLCIRNVSPAPFLAPRFAICRAVVLFSATLCPREFHRRLLGLPHNAQWMDVDSPFGAHQLDVRVERGISTRFRDRPRSIAPIAALIGRECRARPGNYLAFFSSFDYLRSVLGEFRSRFPDVATWEQVRGMQAAQREAFVGNFTSSSAGVGFAVLGGLFGEGIDLPGDRLIGAFIATLGLPGVSDVNLEMQRRMQSLFDAGYEYTYLYPGLQKVVQAAGRVIRTSSDRGTVVLIDDRYMAPRVRELLPSWWRIRVSP